MPEFRAIAVGFPPASAADWRKLAERGRSGAADRLASTSMDGLRIGPIEAPGGGPVLAMRPAGRAWTIVECIDQGDDDAIRNKVRAALKGGATGIELVFASGTATPCRGIDPRTDLTQFMSELRVPVRLDAGEQTPWMALEFARSGASIVSAYDPIATMAALGSPARPIEDSAADIAGLIEAMDREALPGVAFIADGRLWHDRGASEVQELGAVLGSAVATLRLLAARGVEARRAASRLGVALSADADQFLTIAKFRAVRLLFARLAEIAGYDMARPPVHAETAWRMLARREPTMNMVRATTATFAAATGGADSITVLSPVLEGGALDARMARNTQSILLEESSLYRAGDPGAGAGAVEALTGQLAAAAWDLFTRIEAEGGLVASVQSGSIQHAVEAMRDSRLDRVARRQLPLVGVNVHVDGTTAIPAGPPPVSLFARQAATTFRPMRLAEPFEALCARSLDPGGRRPRVMLVRTGAGGDPAGVSDAFAAGGFEVVHGDAGDGDSLAGAFARSEARAACIVDADGQDVARAASALRAAGARVLVAAGLPTGAAPSGMFDAFLSPDTDLVSLLSHVLDRIAEPDENGHSLTRGQQEVGT